MINSLLLLGVTPEKMIKVGVTKRFQVGVVSLPVVPGAQWVAVDQPLLLLVRIVDPIPVGVVRSYRNGWNLDISSSNYHYSLSWLYFCVYLPTIFISSFFSSLEGVPSPRCPLLPLLSVSAPFYVQSRIAFPVTVRLIGWAWSPNRHAYHSRVSLCLCYPLSKTEDFLFNGGEQGEFLTDQCLYPLIQLHIVPYLISNFKHTTLKLCFPHCVTKVIARPDLPARAVRPTLWM